MSTEIEINSPKRLRHLKLVSMIIALIAAIYLLVALVAPERF